MLRQRVRLVAVGKSGEGRKSGRRRALVVGRIARGRVGEVDAGDMGAGEEVVGGEVHEEEGVAVFE